MDESTYETCRMEPATIKYMSYDFGGDISEGDSIAVIAAGYPDITNLADGTDATVPMLRSVQFSGAVVVFSIYSPATDGRYKIEIKAGTAFGELVEGGIILEVAQV